MGLGWSLPALLCVFNQVSATVWALSVYWRHRPSHLTVLLRLARGLAHSRCSITV